MSGLRKVLGSEAVLTSPAGYEPRVDPDCVDLLVFERELDRGRALLARAVKAFARKGDEVSRARAEAIQRAGVTRTAGGSRRSSQSAEKAANPKTTASPGKSAERSAPSTAPATSGPSANPTANELVDNAM